MTHKHSISVFPVVRRLLSGAGPLVAVLLLAACSANDPGARATGTSDSTESVNTDGTKTRLGESTPDWTLDDCKSAKWPKGDFQAFTAFCRAQAASARGNAESVRNLSTALDGDVSSHRATLAELNFADVPIWSDTDINEQFSRARDDRYLTQFDAAEPDFPRRMSWLFPDDGCFARAEQVDVRVAEAGKERPYKLFAFGDLRVKTDNSPEGWVYWRYHVVPVVKNGAGEPIVFDPALSPCKPLPYKQWLALMVDKITDYDNVAGGFGVALGDSWAYWPNSLPSGERSHSDDSLIDLQGNYLAEEWKRQSELGRDPTVILGEQPPWSGDACRGE